MTTSDHISPGRLAAVVAMALTFAAPAAAQGPPAPGTPPPAGVPPTLPEPAPATAAEPEPAPAAPPEAAVPEGGSALTTRRLTLNGRRIEVPLRCAAPGQVTLARRGVRLGRTTFACEDQLAVAEVRLRSRVARRLASHRRVRLQVVIDVAGVRRVQRAILRIPRAARASATWSASAFCGSRYSINPSGFAVSPPSFASQTATGEWMWYRAWRYWHGYGWELTEDWQGPVWAPALGQGATVIIGNTMIDYVDDYRGWYIAAGYQVHHGSTGTASFEWAPMTQVYFGLPVYGGWWCHP